MKPEQKQSELERHRAILLATYDYLEERLGGSFVYDQYDPLRDYFQQQKIQTEKYVKQRRLDRLQQQLAKLTKGLQNKTDLAFAPYIQEKTGYDIDIFEEVKKRVTAIIAQKEIRSQNELNDVGMLLHFYQETASGGEEVEQLKQLHTTYSTQTNTTSRKRNAVHLEVICKVNKDDLEEVTVSLSSGAKTKHMKEQEALSPDGKRKLRVTQWGNGKQASTFVAVELSAAHGAVYAISGVHDDIKAWWKDNSTIIIETKKEYPANTQHRQVQSFDAIISIEYIDL